MPSQEKHKSVYSAVLEWCRQGATVAPPRSDQSISSAGERPQTSNGFETPAPPCYFFDSSLLFRCMDMLQVDRSNLARNDPLLFRELQGVCALCRSKEECSQDLAYEFDDARWNKWRLYCPNSAMLATIGAVDAATQSIAPHPPRGMALLRDPLLNKGASFTERERDALGLRGLLPATGENLLRLILNAGGGYHVLLAGMERILSPFSRKAFDTSPVRAGDARAAMRGVQIRAGLRSP